MLLMLRSTDNLESASSGTSWELGSETITLEETGYSVPERTLGDHGPTSNHDDFFPESPIRSLSPIPEPLPVQHLSYTQFPQDLQLPGPLVKVHPAPSPLQSPPPSRGITTAVTTSSSNASLFTKSAVAAIAAAALHTNTNKRKKKRNSTSAFDAKKEPRAKKSRSTRSKGSQSTSTEAASSALASKADHEEATQVQVPVPFDPEAHVLAVANLCSEWMKSKHLHAKADKHWGSTISSELLSQAVNLMYSHRSNLFRKRSRSTQLSKESRLISGYLLYMCTLAHNLPLSEQQFAQLFGISELQDKSKARTTWAIVISLLKENNTIPRLDLETLSRRLVSWVVTATLERKRKKLVPMCATMEDTCLLAQQYLDLVLSHKDLQSKIQGSARDPGFSAATAPSSPGALCPVEFRDVVKSSKLQNRLWTIPAALACLELCDVERNLCITWRDMERMFDVPEKRLYEYKSVFESKRYDPEARVAIFLSTRMQCNVDMGFEVLLTKKFKELTNRAFKALSAVMVTGDAEGSADADADADADVEMKHSERATASEEKPEQFPEPLPAPQSQPEPETQAQEEAQSQSPSPTEQNVQKECPEESSDDWASVL